MTLLSPSTHDTLSLTILEVGPRQKPMGRTLYTVRWHCCDDVKELRHEVLLARRWAYIKTGEVQLCPLCANRRAVAARVEREANLMERVPTLGPPYLKPWYVQPAIAWPRPAGLDLLVGEQA